MLKTILLKLLKTTSAMHSNLSTRRKSESRSAFESYCKIERTYYTLEWQTSIATLIWLNHTEYFGIPSISTYMPLGTCPYKSIRINEIPFLSSTNPAFSMYFDWSGCGNHHHLSYSPFLLPCKYIGLCTHNAGLSVDQSVWK